MNPRWVTGIVQFNEFQACLGARPVTYGLLRGFQREGDCLLEGVHDVASDGGLFDVRHTLSSHGVGELDPVVMLEVLGVGQRVLERD